MDIQSFIESGLLESYAPGQNTPEERILVEEMLAQHPQARTELASIEQALEQYANAQAVTPPPELKERILQEIDRLKTPMPPPGSTQLLGGRNMLRGFQLLSLALLALTVYFFLAQNQEKAQRENVQQQIAQLEQRLGDCDTQNQRTQEIVNIIRSPYTRAVKMDNKVDAPAFVFDHNAPDKCQLLLDVAALPTQSSGNYLQFWALVNGKPVEIGMIQGNTGIGFQQFECVAGASGYAVSIENNPNGNRTPTKVLMAG